MNDSDLSLRPRPGETAEDVIERVTRAAKEPEQPRFVIEIALGNEAMQTGRDVADALARIQHRIEDLLMPLAEQNVGYTEPIRDGNGNDVGTWTVES